MKNTELKLDLAMDEVGVNVFTLTLTSEHPLQGAKVAMVENDGETGTPLDMFSLNPEL